MARLLIHVEGQTEENFVKKVLAPHLYGCGYERVAARLMGSSAQRNRRGGIRAWSAVRVEIIKLLKEDPGSRASTMVDYYALPATGPKAWPGRQAAANLPFARKTPTIQNELLADVCRELGDNFNPKRFVPYVMMHEFEGLLFSDCQRFCQAIGRPELTPRMQAIRDEFETPEQINDAPQTAPSKRIQTVAPDYQKSQDGINAALAIGLQTIRRECPLFHDWLNRLGA
jgi:hypothetical protein